MISERRLERRPKARSLFDRAILTRAIVDSFLKLDPRWQFRNPVMFVCEIGALVTLGFFFRDLRTHGPAGFDFAISIWLWFTVLFANFAEAVAEGRGKAQADFLRRTKTDTKARRIVDGREEIVSSTELRKGDVVPRGRGRADRGRRRRGRGCGHGRRVGDHRRVCARHPRSRGRSQFGHGRYARAFGQHPRAGHRQSGRGVPRSHDRARRRRHASEDARTRSRSRS